MSGSTSSATGIFHVVNGQIIDPSGNPYKAEGINLYDSQMGDAAQVLADFPGINFIRLNVYSYQDPSLYANFIQSMTSRGIVVELEDHTNSTGGNAGGGQGSAFTGQQLTDESNWYASVAGAYANNPYVWFGTNNEPPIDGLSQWQQATYDAIRGAGNDNPVMIMLPGGGAPNFTVQNYGMDPNVYAQMTNIVADAHFYGWGANYSTDQSTVDAALAQEVQGAQTVVSQDGAVPVIIGEYGPSTDGQSTDADGSQVIQAVQTSSATAGSAAWGWDAGANDNLTDGSGQLTSYGQTVAQGIGSTPAFASAPPATASGSSSVTVPADTITVHLSEDAWQGDAQFQLLIDGQAVTAAQTVTTLHDSGGWQDMTFAAAMGAGTHTIGVQFINDAYGGAPDMDRNLYVNGLDVNGTHYGSSVTAMMTNDTANFMATIQQ